MFDIFYARYNHEFEFFGGWLANLEFGRCSLFPSWSGIGLISNLVYRPIPLEIRHKSLHDAMIEAGK